MFPQLGLKASSDPAQIEDRLKYHPQTFEFFTDVHNFTPAGLAELKAGIRSVQGAGIDQIVIHQPMKFGDIHSELAAPQTAFPTCTTLSNAPPLPSWSWPANLTFKS